jgi:hypothetical protein
MQVILAEILSRASSIYRTDEKHNNQTTTTTTTTTRSVARVLQENTNESYH